MIKHIFIYFFYKKLHLRKSIIHLHLINQWKLGLQQERNEANSTCYKSLETTVKQ